VVATRGELLARQPPCQAVQSTSDTVSSIPLQCLWDDWRREGSEGT